MSTATETLPSIAAPAPLELSGKILACGIALGSFAALLLELALTRLFSVVLFYHFAFLAISIALLGLGAGGVCAYLAKTRLARLETRTLLARLSALNALLIPVVLEVVLHVPVSLKLTGSYFLTLTDIYLASAMPFFITGLQFSTLFARESRHIPRLYGADLAGGALACIGIVPLLNWIGGPNTILFAAAIASIAGAVWANSVLARKATLVLAGAILLLISANHSGKLIDIVYAKGELRDPSWVEFARWNAISRVEVDRQGDTKAIVIDADASTYIMNADLTQWQGTEWEKNLMASPPAVVNVLRPHGDYAIIGPGGGVDMLRAVANGSPDVTGIEINPIIATDIMRRRYADFAYHLYERAQVHLHVSDGRSFIRNTSQQFDVVQMTLVDTWASTAAGAFALSENSLYTTEAFREYFQHLKLDGMVAVTRWEFKEPREALRVVSVAMNALHQLGITDATSHFIVISESELDEDGINVAVLAKKSAFTPKEEESVRLHIANNPPMQILYSPSGTEHNAFAGLIKSNDPHGFSRNYAYNVTPVSDNAPFFFFTLKPRQVFRPNRDHAMDWKVNLGVAVLVMLLVISIVAVLLFLIVPLIFDRIHGSASGLFYFIAVGLGFILVELTFIQRFVSFLGHPTYALTVVIFLMLLASGAGSLASRKLLPHERGLWFPLLIIVAALLAYVAVLPALLDHFVGAAFPVKILISGILLVPLGFAMGMPF